MSDDDAEFEGLAKRYLDLWQDQVNALATDPNMAEAIAKGIRAFSGGVADVMANAQTMGAQMGGSHEPAATQTQPPHATGAEAASPSSADPNNDIAELLGRIAQLEKRVAELEKLGRGKAAASPAKRAAKSKSRTDGTFS